jgi:hypothetical protein
VTTDCGGTWLCRYSNAAAVMPATNLSPVMPGLGPGIHAFISSSKKDVDGRSKPGHDEIKQSGLIRPDRERADRDDVAIAVGLDAIGERLVDGVLLARRLQ